MRLFLSSYKTGGHEKELLGLMNGDSEVGVITNARDYKSAIERAKSVQNVTNTFRSLNVLASEIDLRPHFDGSPEVLREQLGRYPFIWVDGGNTFVLRRALKYSGADEILDELVRSGQVGYGGESAGAILATPTLTGVEFGDDPNIIPDGYSSEVVMPGLNFVPYHIVPHYQSEWAGAQPMIDELERNNHSYRTLTNSQAILINGDQEEFLK